MQVSIKALTFLSTLVVIGGAQFVQPRELIGTRRAKACHYELVDSCGSTGDGYFLCGEIGAPGVNTFCEPCEAGPTFCDDYRYILACCMGPS